MRLLHTAAGGSRAAFLDPVPFLPLPSGVLGLSRSQIASIKEP